MTGDIAQHVTSLGQIRQGFKTREGELYNEVKEEVELEQFLNPPVGGFNSAYGGLAAGFYSGFKGRGLRLKYMADNPQPHTIVQDEEETNVDFTTVGDERIPNKVMGRRVRDRQVPNPQPYDESVQTRVRIVDDTPANPTIGSQNRINNNIIF
tara:strand:+ start:120 stop:578 length:459 start_codon:yes stop_codon:yes gene_type:complete